MSQWRAAVLVLCASSVQASEPPRLAGTVVTPDQRVALFAIPPAGIVPATTGDTVDGYVVGDIEPGRVHLQQGEHRLVVSIEGAVTARPAPADAGGVTFGLVLHQQGPPDD